MAPVASANVTRFRSTMNPRSASLATVACSGSHVMLNPGIADVCRRNSRIADFPTTAGWPGGMTMASSDQNERVRSRSPLAAVRAQSRLVCMSAARSDSRFITPPNGNGNGQSTRNRVLVARVVPPIERSTKTTSNHSGVGAALYSDRFSGTSLISAASHRTHATREFGTAGRWPQLEALREVAAHSGNLRSDYCESADPGHAGWLTAFVRLLCGTSARAAL